MDEKLILLSDRFEIIDAVNNIAICADMGDWNKLIDDVFLDEVSIDYRSLFGGDIAKLSSAELINAWKSVLPGFESTQHMLSNHQVFIDGEKASARAYVRANHFLPNRTGGNTWVVGGYYDYELIKQSSKWRVGFMRLTVQYTEGNENLINLAKSRLLK